MSRETDRIAYLEALCRTVPYHIVEAVLADPDEHSIATQTFDGSAMFADVVGFTALCERLASAGAEGLSRLSDILNELFTQLLNDAIFPYDGYVIQFGGDSLTVVFRGDDHERRCVAAALSCQRIMYGEAGRLLGGKSGELMLRVGLARGTIRLSIIGDLNRRAAVCAGPTAHRMLALQQMAEPNTIVADIAFAEALAGNAEVVDRKEGTCKIRGLRQFPPTVKIPPLGERTKAGVEPKIALLQPFVPEPLAARMRSTPKGWRIQGELREVVVAFLEIWSIDEFLVDEDSSQIGQNIARSVLRAYRKYGGMVAKVDLADRGHRTLVVFGLHRPSENDAERALLAALEATTRLKAYTVAQGIDIQVRTGVHTGRVYFGAIGSAYKHDITVVGDAVNVAARTTAAAEPFEVLATSTVLEAAGGQFESSSRGPMRVKGKTSTISMHVVHAPATERAHFAIARKTSRFVAGREEEIATLEDATDRALNGDGQIIGLCGNAGTGKSFLLAKVIDRWVRGGGMGVIGRCRYATRSVPLSPAVSMFANFLGLTNADRGPRRAALIRQGLEQFELSDTDGLVALLQPVARPDGSSEALVDLADSHAQDKVLSAIVEFVGQRLTQEPLLYVLEDLHFADTLTLELTKRLTAAKLGDRFLMLGTYRPDPILTGVRRNFSREVSLGNLSLQESSALVAHEAQSRDVDADLAIFLWQRSGGNPGHLIEIVRFLLARQLISVRADVALAPDPGIELLENIVPRTLQQVTLARLDGLGASERRLLRMASAIGRRFGRNLLEEVVDTDMDTDRVADAIGTLEGQRVIVPSPHESHGYMFRDGVTRAVTYGTIPDPERRDIHRRIADSLENLGDEDPRRAAAAIALHRDRAQQWAAAAKYFRRAAQQAMRAGLDREAYDLVERYENAVRRLPDADKPSINRRSRMALLKLVATGRQGQSARVVRLARQLSGEFWEVLNESDRAVVDYWLGQALMGLGRPEKAQDRLERVYNASVGDAQRSDAARLLARTYEHAHDAEKAELWLDRAEGLCRGDKYRLKRIDLVRGNLLLDQGHTDEARKIYARIKKSTKRSDHLLIAATATSSLAYCDLLTGDFDSAKRGFSEALHMGRTLRNWGTEANDELNLGQAYLWGGNADLAKPHLERAMALAEDVGDELTIGEAMVHLGAAIAQTKDPVEGTVMVEEGFKRVVRGGFREGEVAADLHLLRIAILRRDDNAVVAGIKRCAAHGDHLANVPLFQMVLEELEGEAAKIGVTVS